MDDTTLLIAAVLGFMYFHSRKSDGASADDSSGSDAPTRVTTSTTTRVVDNKATDAGSTVTELANDGKVVATDIVDVFKMFNDASTADS